MKINEFKQILRTLIREQHREMFQNDDDAVHRLAKVIYNHYNEVDGHAKTYQEFDMIMRGWLMTQPRIWNRQSINLALRRVWKLVHRGIDSDNFHNDQIEAGINSQESQLSELAKDLLAHFEEHGEDIDSVDDLIDSFERMTPWAEEIPEEEMNDAASEAWHFAHG